jgi:hypothetical protein
MTPAYWNWMTINHLRTGREGIRPAVEGFSREKMPVGQIRTSFPWTSFPFGHTHGRALRGVADRLLAVLVAILKTGLPYDSALRNPPQLQQS